VSSLVNALACGVLSCCRCLCFSSSSLCPPLGKELYVGTTIHTVLTASTYNTKVRFPNCTGCKEFFPRAREDRTIFFAKNNISTRWQFLFYAFFEPAGQTTLGRKYTTLGNLVFYLFCRFFIYYTVTYI
jgi:hypothetical protein